MIGTHVIMNMGQGTARALTLVNVDLSPPCPDLLGLF
jgi:hypothetical protein